MWFIFSIFCAVFLYSFLDKPRSATGCNCVCTWTWTYRYSWIFTPEKWSIRGKRKGNRFIGHFLDNNSTTTRLVGRTTGEGHPNRKCRKPILCCCCQYPFPTLLFNLISLILSDNLSSQPQTKINLPPRRYSFFTYHHLYATSSTYPRRATFSGTDPENAGRVPSSSSGQF